MSALSVGVIGVGAFGSKVALRLLWNGWSSLQLYDVNDISTRQFTNDYGGMTNGSPKMMAQCCDVIVTVLPTAAELREVCFGWENVAKGFENGGVVVNLGLGEPTDIAAIARELGERGVDFVDAPAFGTPAQAKEGKLVLVVGAQEPVFERVRPVLEALATRVDRVGLPGAPQAIGALRDYLRASELVVACEAMRIGERFGLDPAYVTRLADSTGEKRIGDVLRDEVLTRRFETGRSLGMIRGNVERAGKLAASLGLVSPMLEATRGVWGQAEARFGSGADYSAFVKWLETLQPQPPAEPKA